LLRFGFFICMVIGEQVCPYFFFLYFYWLSE
jgi:hypothetical protein